MTLQPTTERAPETRGASQPERDRPGWAPTAVAAYPGGIVPDDVP